MREEQVLESQGPTLEPTPMEYRPTDTELLREYDVKIRFCSRGMVIHVGCKEIPFTTVEEGMKEFNEYVNNPWEAQKKWREVLA